MVCKVPTEEVFIKIMEKVVQAELGTEARLFWEALVRFPAMGRGKPIENRQTGCAGKLFRNDSRIIQDEPILSNFSLRFVDKTLMNR
jgi:hypothetical protein